MTVPVYCTAANDSVAWEVVAAVGAVDADREQVSLVWRSPPAGLSGGPSGGISGSSRRTMPGPTVTARVGALGAWPGLASVPVRDLGRVIAAGPIRDAFDGAATGESMRLAPAMVWAGIPDYEARYYAGLVHLGSIFILAHAREQIEAERIQRGWERCGAREIAFSLMAQEWNAKQIADLNVPG